MTARLTSRDRLARLLSVIPWVADHEDGAQLDDISQRFDYPRGQLLDDLQEVVFFVGVHPFSPDSLIEVELRGDRVHISYADWFSRPLRLTAEQGARLLTAGQSVLALSAPPEGEGADAEGTEPSPLLRALTKLGTALGDGAHRAVEVRLGNAATETLEVLRSAAATRTKVALQYYSYGRDELTERTVEPSEVFSDQGNWYLSGWCHRADEERVFRVDRIRQAIDTGEPATVQPTSPPAVFSPSGDDPRAVLSLDSRARWVAEQYPTDSVVERGGRVEVTLAVTAVPWLERLLLRLGTDAEIIALDPALPTTIREMAADRLLARYGH